MHAIAHMHVCTHVSTHVYATHIHIHKIIIFEKLKKGKEKKVRVINTSVPEVEARLP